MGAGVVDLAPRFSGKKSVETPGGATGIKGLFQNLRQKPNTTAQGQDSQPRVGPKPGLRDVGGLGLDKLAFNLKKLQSSFSKPSIGLPAPVNNPADSNRGSIGPNGNVKRGSSFMAQGTRDSKFGNLAGVVGRSSGKFIQVSMGKDAGNGPTNLFNKMRGFISNFAGNLEEEESLQHPEAIEKTPSIILDTTVGSLSEDETSSLNSQSSSTSIQSGKTVYISDTKDGNSKQLVAGEPITQDIFSSKFVKTLTCDQLSSAHRKDQDFDTLLDTIKEETLYRADIVSTHGAPTKTGSKSDSGQQILSPGASKKSKNVKFVSKAHQLTKFKMALTEKKSPRSLLVANWVMYITILLIIGNNIKDYTLYVDRFDAIKRFTRDVSDLGRISNSLLQSTNFMQREKLAKRAPYVTSNSIDDPLEKILLQNAIEAHSTGTESYFRALEKRLSSGNVSPILYDYFFMSELSWTIKDQPIKLSLTNYYIQEFGAINTFFAFLKNPGPNDPNLIHENLALANHKIYSDWILENFKDFTQRYASGLVHDFIVY
jgi:hypothetical protein